MPRHFAMLLFGPTMLLPLITGTPAGALVTTELVASGLNWPVYVTAPAGDDRLFIVEQQGIIRILKDGSVLPTPFLDITALVKDPSAYSEQGLLGLAFDPDFASNRVFYVHYTDNDGNTMIARYEVNAMDPDVADPGTAMTVLTQVQPQSNHNGGNIDFGPDGYFYFGFGDGGGAGDQNDLAQDPSTLLGKMIRIDVDPLPYSIPPDNPFVGNASVLDEIWAIGVRNPYRWSFDRSTGDLWIGDVGQNAWEEIDFEPAASGGGRDYGWRLMEGFHCYNPPTNCGSDTLDLPIYEYGHTEGNCSITGGYVYRGAEIPDLQGYYLFGDYCSNRIWALQYDGSQITSLVELTDLLNPDGRVSGLSAIGQDGLGELYLVDRDGTAEGEVYKIVSDPSGVQEDAGPAHSLRMGPAVPNPSSARTALELTLPAPGDVSVRVFNAAGRSIRTILSGDAAAGSRRVEWDGRDARGDVVPSGVYFVKAELNGEIVTRMVSVVR
jgi:glucose/arabinose dehydrogenase